MPLFQPSGLVRAIPRSGAGYFAHGGKSNQNAAGVPPDPLFCPIGRKQGEMPGCH